MNRYTVLNLPPGIMKKIDQSRGQLSRSEFLDCLVRSWCLEHGTKQRYVSREEVRVFEDGIKNLLRSFLDFFVSYGLELEVFAAESLPQLLDQLQPDGHATHRQSSSNGASKVRGHDLSPRSRGHSDDLGDMVAE